MNAAVVVGVDGSQAALNAVRWAVAEAANRGVALRLVHASPRATRRRGPIKIDRDDEGIDSPLREAEDLIEVGRARVAVESAVVCGDPESALVIESRNAALVCIGSLASERPGHSSLGSTGAALAVHAHCPVAVVRTNRDGSWAKTGVISVVLNDDDDNDEVVHAAMQQGRLRRATVRQVDRRRNSWVRKYPDVRVETVACGTGRHYADRRRDDDGLQLAVVGRSDANTIAGLATPNCHPIMGYPDCSVLIVRN